MAAFKGFKDSGYNKIAKAMGYNGPMDRFKDFLASNPAMQKKMDDYTTKAMRMARGGVVKKFVDGGDPSPYEQDESGEGGFIYDSTKNTGDTGNAGDTGDTGETGDTGDTGQGQQQEEYKEPMIGEIAAKRAQSPELLYGTTVQPVGVGYEAETQDISDTSGQVTGDLAYTAKQATAAQAATGAPTADPTKEGTTPTGYAYETYDATKTEDDIKEAVKEFDAATGEVSKEVEAQTADASLVANLDAAQGEALIAKNEITRELQEGEKIDAVANAQKAAAFTEKIEAATATPSEKATVQGQLAELTENFDAKNPPAWAAGALRSVQAQLAQRGLGASSIAGQALIQATLESALPIAQADAATQAQFESQNLSNRQQRAMLAAQQRAEFIGQEFDQEFQARVANAAKISDIANMNFTADQQIQLENARAANTMNMENLNNKQALVLAEASALAGMDLSNLNNRQQAQVQNAQNFLQMDLSNLSNEQQTAVIGQQAIVNSIFNDQAADNAAKNFNASSANQVDQFYNQLTQLNNQFNAAQSNAIAQFNAGEENAALQFVQTLKNQREQFNAANKLVIDQANAQWRRDIATADTVAINRANELNVSNLLEMSQDAFNKLYATFDDNIEFAWRSAENEAEIAGSITRAQIEAASALNLKQLTIDDKNSSILGAGIIKGLDYVLGEDGLDLGLGDLSKIFDFGGTDDIFDIIGL